MRPGAGVVEEGFTEGRKGKIRAAGPGKPRIVRYSPGVRCGRYQYRIAELVREVARAVQLGAGALQDRIARERAQQLVMAGARLVRAADDRIDDAQPRGRTQALVGQAGPRAQRSARCRMLQRTGHGRPERDHPRPALLGTRDRAHGCGRQVVGLIERQAGIQYVVAGG
jgi:hypothetical protein